MKRVATLAMILSVGLLSGCKNSPTKVTKKEEVPTWSSKMTGLAGNVQRLTPFIYSQKEYYKPGNRQQIKESLASFSTELHQISPEMGQKFLGPDPILKYSLDRLIEDVERAGEAFELGQLEYSRSSMKAVLNHCFRCHTMSKMEERAQWDIAAAFKNIELPPLEKADLLVAGRKYDEALVTLEDMLNNKQFIQSSPFHFEAALRKYLAITVRVKESPERALHELEKVVEREDIPFYIQEQARSWKQSLLDWSRERKAGKEVGKGSLLKQAKERIQKAHKLQQYAKDHAGDVEFLRASTLLHASLKQAKKQKEFAEIYYLLGESYEVLDGLSHWNLHETYYDACVRTLPKSPLAKQCFRRLQSSVYLGFSGSSGVHIPVNERQRLNELRKLVR